MDILKAAADGDPLGKAVMDLEAERIALYIAAIAAVTDVELVVLAGGIGRQAASFYDPIKAWIAEIVPFPPRLEISTLGDSGILVGALRVGISQARDLVFQQAHTHPPLTAPIASSI